MKALFSLLKPFQQLPTSLKYSTKMLLVMQVEDKKESQGAKARTGKSKNELLQQTLFRDTKSAWLKLKDTKAILSFAEQYKAFIAEAKTERQCVLKVVEILQKHGFKDIRTLKEAKAGTKLYKNLRDKAVFAAVVGKDPTMWQLIGSHVDSPRLDIKPNPLIEDADVAIFKTHYYGGIKKYHWVNVPLAMHGIIYTKAGKKITISIGDKDDEPKFLIPDLLPHLAKLQMERKAAQAIEGEELSLIVGHLPVSDEKIKEKVKFMILQHLHEKYGIVEEDFFCAELELVPAGKAIDVGFDAGLVGAYGQDDKVCVFTLLMALLETKNNPHTAVSFFVDKEEIGSSGDTGAASLILQNFAYEYARLLNLTMDVSCLFERSHAISADVTAGVCPNFKDAHDLSNASFLGKGVSVEKYGGGGGKYDTHDASSEYMNYMRKILDAHKIPWQTGEIGKIDLGGGGTIGMFLSRYGMHCVDAGPCVLAMHSTCEIASKVDIYCAYLLYKAFFRE